MKMCSLEPGLKFQYWLIDDQQEDPSNVMVLVNNQSLEIHNL